MLNLLNEATILYLGQENGISSMINQMHVRNMMYEMKLSVIQKF